MLRSENIFDIIFLIGFVAGSVIRKVYTARCRGHKAARRHFTVSDTALITLAGVGMVAPLIYLFSSWMDCADYDLPVWMGWTGTVAFAGALVLLWRSHADLGANWSAILQIRPEHSLVTHGIYRYIRHPMYAAHLLWAIAQALLLGNWLAGWAFMVTFVPLYLLRVPREEEMMLEQFGQAYRDYMSRTGRMIPRFWR
ncbi:MAG: isoprenylcysteine carboxylmethyltransferase family protein [Phycisphaerales bacterium]|nr:MAG: isoprenylcysteine carboxylmethyltransferase family protein [Phycisphaerales bacterium]